MQAVTTTKWLQIVRISNEGKKTERFEVFTQSNVLIGEIKWYGPFRKYSFFPRKETVYESTCLKDIATFLDKLMLERKIEKQKS